jgi:acyl-homoserine-lactone acylase
MSPARLMRALVLIITLCATGRAAPEAPGERAGAQVTIYRDTWGVPHVYASSEAAGFYGLGFAQAQDRLPQLLAGALWVQGRRAEILGDADLASDIEIRRWRHFEEARTNGLAHLSPQLQSDYRAFIAGAKRYMAEHLDRVPRWAPELTPETLIALSRALYFVGYDAPLGSAKCAKSGVALQLGLDGHWVNAPTGASNEWLVRAPLASDGKTILLADPHVQMDNPFYYEYSLHTPSLESAGFAAGALLWQANNRHLGWALTTGNPDLWDCYAVQTSAEDPREFLFDGVPQHMEVHHEVFHSSSGKSIAIDFEYTHHNGVLSPVVARQGAVAYAVSVSQMHDAGLFDDEIYRMNRAGNVQQLRAAAKTLGMLPQNLLAADDRGGAYYLRAGKTPHRPSGYDWSGPVPGNSSATAWLGIHPLEEMIEVLNPPQAFMQNNNVAPDRLFAAGNLQAARYPDYMFNDRPGRLTTRGQRVLDVLSAARHFSIQDAKALVFDEFWISTPTWQAALRAAVRKQRRCYRALSLPARAMVDRILVFDGRARAQSAAALNFYFWRGFTGEIWHQHPEFAALRTWPLPATLSDGFECALLEAAEAAAAAQIKTVGGIDEPLGKLFRVGHGEKSFALGGATIHANSDSKRSDTLIPDYDSTLRAFEFTPLDTHGERLATQGSQAIRLMSFGPAGLETWSLYAYGETTTPGAHFADQVPLISRAELKPGLFDKAELMQHLESTLVLEIPAESLGTEP